MRGIDGRFIQKRWVRELLDEGLLKGLDRCETLSAAGLPAVDA